jgi:geranylgeranyl diphosphate synthase, type I
MISAILRSMTADPRVAVLRDLRDRVDDALRDALRSGREELALLDPGATGPVDEVIRLVEAGGSRLRPLCCYWGFRAAGGADGDRIVRAAAALELLHTMALIHDDVMDGAAERRGVPSSHVHLASLARRRGDADPERTGRSVAILAGDLAAVLADLLLLEAGFGGERLAAALAPYHRMRLAMAAGQYLDVAGHAAGAHDVDPRHLAGLKGGAYSVEGPLLVGAALAGAGDQVVGCLQRFGSPLGQAFQLRDDLRDGDAAPGVGPADVAALVNEALDALDANVLGSESAGALTTLARQVAGS